nr:penicillin-binding transpeptidase domain-containing protein [Methylobrevis pamukkalensis]
MANWRATTDPTLWMKNSVVWYSQLITADLGNGGFDRYVKAFDYGNEDTSGDPGKDNGLTESWLGSSLEISPREQVTFLRRLVGRDLPVKAAAFDMTEQLMDIGPQPGGWHVYGKTGAAPSRLPDGTNARGQPWGWFVGWATKGERTVVFSRLTKDTTRPEVSPGIAARKALIEELFSADGKL